MDERGDEGLIHSGQQINETFDHESEGHEMGTESESNTGTAPSPQPPPSYQSIENVSVMRNGTGTVDPRRLSVADLAPHIDHYRNIISMSRQGGHAGRPSLAELHLRIDDLPEPRGINEAAVVSDA